MRPIPVIAGQELARGLRNKWVASSVALMTALSLSLALLGSTPAGNVGAGPLEVLIASLASLSVFLLPLIALLLAHDAIAGEAERGTLLLTLAYPVSRWQLLAGKLLGHTVILAFAVLLGFGSAALAATADGVAAGGAWHAFFRLVASAIAMGAVFLGLGYLASALVAERSTAIGLAVGVWLMFVLVYDLAFLGLLVTIGDRLPDAVVGALILFNPADVFRLLNLGNSAAIALGTSADIVGSKAGLGPTVLAASLLAWLAVGLGLAWLAFKRREI